MREHATMSRSGGPILTSSSMLQVNEIFAGYGKREVLRGVSLHVNQGEIVTLIGPNGAGKSTLLKVIAGLLTPHSGNVVFRGKDVTQLPAHRRARAGIAYVIQGGAVFPSLTAADHLQLGALVARMSYSSRESEAERILLDRDVASCREPVGLLSGGQRQALAVETMLATEPSLLLCDEPSAGLAPGLAHDLIERIARLSRERGLSVLWVEQRVGDVLPLADRALLLREGTVSAETHCPKEWLAAEVLSELSLGKV
jgi:ABC-type branched-subunit amino acid transport system ATPase component